MKIALNKSRRGEKGQALILVMILLLVGSLIVTPLLGFMSTGLIAGQVFEDKMAQAYAADGGIEDGLWKIKNDQIPAGSYPLTANGKDVTVEIVLEENVETFLEVLLGDDAGPHDEWTTIVEEVVPGSYTITVTYSGSASVKRLSGVGAWLQGDYSLTGSASGITDDYPVFTFTEQAYKGGTAFIWEWTAGNRPVFGTVSGVYERTLIFQFTPADTPSLYFSWIVGGSADIGVVPGSQAFEIWKVTATATDSATGKQTEVVAYTSAVGAAAPYSVGIINWEIS